MRELSSYILLSVQTALSTHVSPHLRAVTVDFDKTKNKLIVHFFYDCEITDELFDLASCATVEMETGAFEFDMNDDFATRLDYPAPIPIEGRLVYLRYEPIQTIYPQKSPIEYADDSLPPIAKLRLIAQYALLGKVTPELRRVTLSIEPTEKQFDFNFYYDGEISKLNFELAHATVRTANSYLPEYKGNANIERVDLPKRVHPSGSANAYRRAEPYDLIDC